MLRSDITDIRLVYKGGAFGNTNAFGAWTYGKRPDGRTVACKSRRLPDGGMTVWSEVFSDGEVTDYRTDFSEAEWDRLFVAGEGLQARECNLIIAERTAETGKATSPNEYRRPG